MDPYNDASPLMAHHAGDTGGSAGSLPPSRPSPAAISGNGKMKFRVLYTSDHLPEEARNVLINAHGGFAVDHRPGQGETYFALPGAGILQITADLKHIRLLPTPDEVKTANLHSTAIWYAMDGKAFLAFASNNQGKIFTTTLDGRLVATLDAPTPENEFDHPEVNDYFLGRGHFVPTGVDHLEGRYYVTTGYSPLDYVLTARIVSTDPFRVEWSDLAFGGKGTTPGQFGTAHAIAVPPGERRLDVADRPNSRIQRFTPHGHYRAMLKMPAGSLPCDIDYLDEFAVVACLDGPDKSKGAPIYILQNDELISTVMPKEDLGLANFVHNHNAAFKKLGARYYIIAQAWNPGDFAIFEQVI